jgi:hypothetical protein
VSLVVRGVLAGCGFFLAMCAGLGFGQHNYLGAVCCSVVGALIWGWVVAKGGGR